MSQAHDRPVEDEVRKLIEAAVAQRWEEFRENHPALAASMPVEASLAGRELSRRLLDEPAFASAMAAGSRAEWTLASATALVDRFLPRLIWSRLRAASPLG